MSPRRTPYRPPRPRREIMVAVAASLALVVFTGVMVWVLGPHPAAAPTAPTLSPSSSATTGPSSTSTPATSAPSSPPST